MCISEMAEHIKTVDAELLEESKVGIHISTRSTRPVHVTVQRAAIMVNDFVSIDFGNGPVILSDSAIAAINRAAVHLRPLRKSV